jgi:hypothetical protein
MAEKIEFFISKTVQIFLRSKKKKEEEETNVPTS